MALNGREQPGVGDFRENTPGDPFTIWAVVQHAFQEEAEETFTLISP